MLKADLCTSSPSRVSGIENLKHMTRYIYLILLALVSTAIIVSCAENPSPSPNDHLHDQLLEAWGSPAISPQPALRSSSPSAGELHNEGYLQVMRQAPFYPSFKSFFMWLDEEFAEDVPAILAQNRSLDFDNPAASESVLLSGGGEAFAAATWRLLCERLHAHPSIDYAAGIAIADTLEGAVLALSASGMLSADKALETLSVFRSSWAMHQGQIMHGIDYSQVSGNLAYELSQDEEVPSEVEVDWIRLALVDAAGIITGNYLAALIASTLDLHEQIDGNWAELWDWVTGGGVVSDEDVGNIPGDRLHYF